jgi:putative acetyltransferase
LAAIWERSIRATHTFLTEEDIAFYRPLTSQILAGDALELWVLTDESDTPIGFLGLAGAAIEALFLEPAYRRRGGGRKLVAHAQALRDLSLTVDVNEENIEARRFYEALGFDVAGRSAVDPMGRPHPLLHLRRSAVPRTYTVTQARPEDLAALPAIELAAARLLADYAPASVLAETTAEEALQAAQASGHLWVALAENVPVGFAHVQILEARIAHIAEIDVHPDHGRRGLGRKLVMAVCVYAETNDYRAVTLTTFRDVPFNMPFYAALGFEVIPAERLSAALREVVEDETRRGLDPDRRVAMCRPSQRLPS